MADSKFDRDRDNDGRDDRDDRRNDSSANRPTRPFPDGPAPPSPSGVDATDVQAANEDAAAKVVAARQASTNPVGPGYGGVERRVAATHYNHPNRRH